jgi:Zn-dependent metalloprotease
MCRSHPIFCILPPHLLSSVCNHGSARQRRWALRTMAADSTFRALRAALAAPPAAAVRRRRGVVEEGQKQRTIYTAKNEETLPGAVVRMEGGPASGDVATDEAYDGLGDTFDLYWQV